MCNDIFKSQLIEVEKNCGIAIPKVFINFISESPQTEFDNGILYHIDQIQAQYFLLEFDKYAPEYIPIGNDNGDYELIMESGIDNKRVGIIEQGSIGSVFPEWLNDFSTWLVTGHSFASLTQNDDDIKWSEYVKVILKKEPIERTKVMMLIRKAFALNVPITKLLSESHNIPYMITDKYTAAQAKHIIEKYHIGEWVCFSS